MVKLEPKVITGPLKSKYEWRKLESTNMVLFRKGDVDRVLSALDVSARGNVILDITGDPAVCHTCGCDIGKSNLGNIMPGSKLFFCDNPVCLATYIAETKT
jgi:hypothetical protein